MSKKRSRASSLASNDTSPSSTAHVSSSKSSTATPSGPLVHASQDLDEFQESFWKYHMDLVEQGGDGEGGIIDFKSGTPTGGQLPLARIKKVMKSDDQVKMISAEAPILFARACEIFISDLTCRAFLIAEEHKRRTIQRSDIAGAIGRSDLFDFLIDIVPRHESLSSSRLPGNRVAKVEKTAEGQNSSRAKSARQASSSSSSYSNNSNKSSSTQNQLLEQQQLTTDATSHYLDLDGHQAQLAMASSTPADHDMSSWLHDSANDNATTSARPGDAQDTHSHLDYAATTVPHAWQHSFTDLGSHHTRTSSVDDRAHVAGLDSLF